MIREIREGVIHRGNYPEIWPLNEIRVVSPGEVTRESEPLAPVTIPKSDRHRLVKSILRGELNPEDFPGIWPAANEIIVILPE